MRLEEYQAWLDSQFLDEEEPAAPPTSEPVPAPAPAQQPVADAKPAAAEPLYFVGVAQAPPPPGRESEPPVQPTPAPLPPAEESAVVASPAQQFRDGNTWTQEVEVPSIERYFPFLRRAEPPVQPPTEPESPPQDEPVQIPIGRRSPVDELATARSEPKPEPPAAPAAEPPAPAPEPAVAPRMEAKSVTAPAPRTRQPQQESASTRTAPRVAVAQRRARYVRAVQPAAEQPGGPVALWSLVPKHIQVLIAMGSDEVTQNSYKRSFKESRLELIERLLDPTLSLEDTARLLNVCPTTVRRYTNRGLLRHLRTQGDQRRFKLSDVLTFLEAQSRSDSVSAQG